MTKDTRTARWLDRRAFIAAAASSAMVSGKAAAGTEPRRIVEFSPEINRETPPGLSSTLHALLKAAPKARSAARLQVGLPPAVEAADIVRADGAVAQVLPSAKAPAGALAPKPRQPEVFDGFHIGWADDAKSVDARHLLQAETTIIGSAPAFGTTFTLTPELLAQVCANNSIWPMRRSQAPVVLFGIRGASAEITDGWRPFVQLSLRTPDHMETCCAMGVWFRGPGHPECLRVFPGSTVPNARYMVEQTGSRAGVCNLPPTGLHRFLVGKHRTIHGAFRQGTPYPVHRLPVRTFDQQRVSNLVFTNEVNDFSWPDLASPEAVRSVGNDLHPAFVPGGKVQFSSAGCQVVVGTQGVDARTGEEAAAGDWEVFRTAADLANPPGGGEDGRPYDYLLVTGRELLITSHAKPDQAALLQRFRFGSIDPPHAQPKALVFAGVTVRDLQKALAAESSKPGAFRERVVKFSDPDQVVVDGKLFGDTMRLVLAWQAATAGYADGIVDRNLLQSLRIV